MAKKTKPSPKESSQAPLAQKDSFLESRILIWFIVGVNSVFLIWQCLDRYLAPRFLFLSVVLTIGMLVLQKDLLRQAKWRSNAFDLLLLGWYGLNLASVSWAYSWSEAIFTAQKTVLLLGVYGFFRYFLEENEALTRKTLRQVINALSIFTVGLLLCQLIYAATQAGLSNEALYAYASGVFGNKSLSADFLFFLLIWQLLLHREQSKRWFFPVIGSLILLLILLLQVRTVYGAVALSAMIYFPFRAYLFRSFRPVFFRRLMPLAALLLLGLAVLILKGEGSLAERLNPMTYMESTSINERRFVWAKTDILNQDHYWWGVGDGSWKIWFPSKSIQGAFRLQEENIVFTRTHNDYLEIRSELGMVGVVYFILLFGMTLLLAIWGIFKQKKDPDKKHDLIVMLLGIFGYCVIQYFDFPRERIEMQVMLALFFAWTVHQSRVIWAASPILNLSKGVFYLVWSMMLGAFAFSAWIGWHRVQGEINNMKLFEAMAKGQYKQAVEWSEKTENPYYEYNDVVLPICWYSGLAKFKMKEVEASISDFKRAYELNPWSFQVINNYATALSTAGRNQEAIPLLEQVLAINPKYEDGKLNLAIVYQNLGQYDKAMQITESVDTVAHPNSAKMFQKNKDILTKKKQMKEYLEYLRKK